jgi:hypothetical protein
MLTKRPVLKPAFHFHISKNPILPDFLYFPCYDSLGSGPNVNASLEISTASQLASKAAQSSVIDTLT